MTASKTVRRSTWMGVAAGLLGAAAMVTLSQPADAVQLPAQSGQSLATTAGDAGVSQVRARGGGGGHFRGGGGHYRGGRGFYGVPLILGPAIGYGAYSYYDSDCRTVRVKEHRCWRDSDGDRHCGYRWGYRRICD